MMKQIILHYSVNIMMKRNFFVDPQRVEIWDENTCILSVKVSKHVFEKLILGGRRIQGTLGRESDGSYTFHPHFRSSSPALPLTRKKAVARVVKLLKSAGYPSFPLLPGLDIFVVPVAPVSLFSSFSQEEGCEYQPDADLFMSHLNGFGRTRA